jgi:hypothetical protein
MKTSTQFDSIKEKPYLNFTISTGLLINKTLGIQPIINVSLGISKNKNGYYLAYEYRFGNSNKYFQLLDNDTLKSVHAYKTEFYGFEYQRTILKNASHELITNIGIGADWILINKNETIKNTKVVGGLALNIGLGYSYFIKKKHGPKIELLYHYADFKTIKGKQIDNNSIIIRLSYNFGNNYQKK